jgi:hypothetical protein
LGGALVVVILAGGAVVASRVCGTSAPPKVEEVSDYPSLEGTLCDVIAKAPPGRARGPLPSEPALAAWTLQVERGIEEALALEAIGEAHDYGHGAPVDEREVACVRKLWAAVARELPARHRMRVVAEETVTRLLRHHDGGSSERVKLARALDASAPSSSAVPGDADALRLLDVATTEPGSSAAKYLAAFPSNARLRRALILHFGPSIEDNYSSRDGDLDQTEIFMRETTASWPERAGLDFELLVASDWTSQDPRQRTWAWLRAPFARITLDLGATGNALRVVRDLQKQHPPIATLLLPVAQRRAAMSVPSNRRARWTALAAYLEAGAPDPGDPPEPALARALEGDDRSARWALGYLPNELEDHAPRPFPYIRDPAVIKGVVARAGRVTTDEDRILALDVLAQMPPGTALATIARSTTSPNEGVWRAAIAAMEGQIQQMPIKAPPGEREADAERRKHAAALLAPHVDVVRAGLVPRLCAHPQAITLLADAADEQLDAELLPCIEGKPQPATDFLATLLRVCVDHRALGWTKSGEALSKTAEAGDRGAYARRVANGCIKGED